jgi:hypothetical protein
LDVHEEQRATKADAENDGNKEESQERVESLQKEVSGDEKVECDRVVGKLRRTAHFTKYARGQGKNLLKRVVTCRTRLSA